MKYELFYVGGYVRDQILGIESHDIDYTVVVTGEITDANEAFAWLQKQLKAEGYVVFATKPEVFTLRTRFPKNHKFAKLVGDFVMARKESGFVEGTRMPLNCVVGTLHDDQLRRDFTVNSIAQDPFTGEIIDPFFGQIHLGLGLLKCPIDAQTSFNDDPLRVLRALRFSITKNFTMSRDVVDGIKSLSIDRFIETVSIERAAEELYKMFAADTHKSFGVINDLKLWNPKLYNYLIQHIWFRPTTAAKRKS